MNKPELILEEIIRILETYGVERWVRILNDIKGQLGRAHQRGSEKLALEALEHLKDLYGDMGSFDDLFISAESGHNIPASEVGQVNARLQRLQTELYQATMAKIERADRK